MTDENIKNNEIQSPAEGGAGGEGGGENGAPGKKVEDGGENADKAALYRPEGLPDHLVGKSEKETIDKLWRSYKGAREELSGKKGVPEKIDDYQISLPEELASKVISAGEDGKDPLFEKFRATLHANGIPAEAGAQILSQVYEAVIDMAGGGGADDEVADLQFQSFGGAEKAQPIIDGSRAFITGLKNTGKLSDEAAGELELLTYHGQGLKLVSELRSLLGDKPIPANLSADKSGSQGEITQEVLNSRVADPRYNPKSKKYDPQFHKETTEMFQSFYNKSA